MKASTLKLQLPDYIRGRLSAEESRRIAAAIKADPALARECERLREYFASLESLPRLKAPVGFAMRVMRRLDEKQEKKSLLDRLFKPFYFKLPLEAGALVATALLLIVLYRPTEKSGPPAMPDLAMAPENAPAPKAEVEQAKTAPAVPSGRPAEPQSPSIEKNKAPAKQRSAKNDAAGGGIGESFSSRIAMADEEKYAPSMPSLPSLGEGKAGGGSLKGGSSGQIAMIEPERYAASRSEPAPREEKAAAAPEGIDHLMKQQQLENQPAASAASAPVAVAQKASLPVSKDQVIVMELALAMEPQVLETMTLKKNIPKRALESREDRTFEREKPQPSDPVESAVRSVGGIIIRKEPGVPRSGSDRYTVELPDSSVAALSGKLAQMGKLTGETVRPMAQPEERVRITLIVRR
jgi:hypothetical protein